MLTRNRLTTNAFNETEQDAVISVGKDFQAKLPKLEAEIPSVYYSKRHRKYEVLFWSSRVVDISENQLNQLILTGKIKYKFTEEMVLGLLKWHKGDVEAVEKDFMEFQPMKEVWNTEDQIKFFLALEYHNKNFNIVKYLFPNKKIGELVSAYYLFKKNVSVLNDFCPAGSNIGSSILSRIKKFDAYLPKHYAIKFNTMIRSLPQMRTSVSLSCNMPWSDHSMAESVKSHLMKIESYHNRHCISKSLDHDYLTDMVKNGRRKRPHKCLYNHKKWLKEFYASYDHEALLKQLGKRESAGEQNEDEKIQDEDNVIQIVYLELMKKSKDCIDQLKRMKSKLPKYNSQWTQQEMDLAQLAVMQSGGDLRKVTDLLGTKSLNMVKNFISLYSQRLQIDEELLQRLLNSNNQ